MKLAVLCFGPRNLFLTNRTVSERFDHLFARFLRLPPSEIMIVHGKARGVDQACGTFARGRGYVEDPHPYLDGLGKRGGPIRNAQMGQRLVDLRDVGVEVFGMAWRWPEWTSGTANMADCLERIGVCFRMEVVR